MVDFIQNCLDGVMLGSSYGLLAIGFTLIFGVMRRLNLSYGPSIMVGVFIGTLVHLEFNANIVAVALATIAGAVIVGIYVERICFWAIRRDAAVASMVSSFVIWMQLEEAVTLAFPDRTYAFPRMVEAGLIELGPFFFKLENLLMFGCALVMTLLLHGLLQHTRFGLALRAVSEYRRAALFMGINVNAVIFLSFVIASAFGGVAAFLVISTDGQITPLFGLWATFKGLIAMMLGGMGSIPGAILGGLLLGVVETQSTWYLGTEYRDLSAFFLLFLFLVFRPGGLLGQVTVEREQAATRRI